MILYHKDMEPSYLSRPAFLVHLSRTKFNTYKSWLLCASVQRCLSRPRHSSAVIPLSPHSVSKRCVLTRNPAHL